MARIVSGAQQPQDPNFALMQGLDMGRSVRQAQLDREQSARAQAGLMLQIQNALQEQAMEEQQLAAQQAEEKHKRALATDSAQQLGKAGRLQQFSQKAQAGLAQPGDKMMQRVIGARSRLQDPKALAMFDDSVSQLVKAQQMAKKRKAAEEAIGMAEKDTDIFPPEMIQGMRQTLEAGGDLDAMVKGIGEHRLKTATKQQVVGENEEALAQIAAMIQSAPPGFGKEQAQIIYNSVARSNSLKEVKGSGARALRAVQEALLGPRSEFGKGESGGDPYDDPELFKAAYSQLVGESRLPEDPSQIQSAVRERMRIMKSSLPAPAPQGVKRAPVMEVHRVVTQTIQSGGSEREIIAAMRAAGIPLTPDNIQIARKAGEDYTNRARMERGGAERAR